MQSGTFSKETWAFGRFVPPTILRGEGPYVILFDGRKFIDTILGLGAIVRGYNKDISLYVSRALHDAGSLTFALPYNDWVSVSEMLSRFLEVDVVRPVRTGSDACLAAVVLARALRPGKVLVVDRNYHGQWLQWKPPARGSLIAPDTFLVVDDANPDTWPDSPFGISCAIYEWPVTPPHEDWYFFLAYLQSKGVILIADEVVTGVRYPGKFALPRWDLIVVGKALANGFGMYVVGGSREFMRGFYPPDPVFVSTTYAADVAAVAGTFKNLTLSNPPADEIGTELFSLGESFQSRLSASFWDETSPVRLEGDPSRVVLKGDVENITRFRKACFDCGVLVNRPVYLSTAHEGVLDKLADAFNFALSEIKSVTLDKGDVPIRLFKER